MMKQEKEGFRHNSDIFSDKIPLFYVTSVKACMHREYHKPRSILHVKRILGHKSIQNTLLYTQLVTFEADRFTCRTAETIEEAKDLIEAGFEFVTHMNGVELFRKPK